MVEAGDYWSIFFFANMFLLRMRMDTSKGSDAYYHVLMRRHDEVVKNEIKEIWAWYHIGFSTCIIAMARLSNSIGYSIQIFIRFINSENKFRRRFEK